MNLLRRLAGLGVVAALLWAAPARAQDSGFATSARHVTILDAASGLVLYCNDCDTPMPPASMSKLMTVLLVAERLQAGRINMETRFHVSLSALGAMAPCPTARTCSLSLTRKSSVRDLLRGLIIVSANDACVVLAEGIAGSEEAFVAEMNARAQALGLRTARFRNATGLPDPDHVISSADLARLARHLIVTYPDLYRIYSERSFTYNNHTQENRNPLLGAFDGADGVKTGHTDDSGYGLVGSAVLNGAAAHHRVQRHALDGRAPQRSAAPDGRGVPRFQRRGACCQPAQQVGEAQVRLGSRRTVPLLRARRHRHRRPRARVQSGLTAHIVYDGPLPAPIARGRGGGAAGGRRAGL